MGSRFFGMDNQPESFLLVRWPATWQRSLRLLFERDPHGRDFWVVEVPLPLQHPSDAWQYVDVAVDKYLEECPDEHKRVGRPRVHRAVRGAVLSAT